MPARAAPLEAHDRPQAAEEGRELQFGPAKSYCRAIDKPITNLNDLNRVTVEFQNPLAYALFYYALCRRFKVSARNKHDQPGGYTQVPCVHMMIDWEGTGYLVEVMLMLTLFLEIKKMQHKAYDVTRTKHVMDLMEGFGQEDEMTKLEHAEVKAERDALKAGAPLPPAPPGSFWRSKET